MILLGCVGELKEIVVVVVWLVLDEFSYVIGIILFVDGGMILYFLF